MDRILDKAPQADRTGVDDCGRCDPSGWATVDDGTPDGAVVRCPHDGSIPAEPASEADPAAADQAWHMFAALSRSLGA